MIERKLGRPGKYGYEKLQVGEKLEIKFRNMDSLRLAQRASLNYAIRTQRRFTTFRIETTLTIIRIE